MSIIKLIIMYRTYKDVVLYNKEVSYDKLVLPKLKKLRTSSVILRLVFNLLVKIKPIRAITKETSNIVVTPYYSKTTNYVPEIDVYIKDICSTIPHWNIFTNIDGLPPIHEIATLPKYDPTTKGYLAEHCVLIKTCRLAHGIRGMYLATKDPYYLSYYNKLLDGVDRCLINNSERKLILRHPSNKISDGLYGVDEEVIANLLLLISGFGVIKDNLSEDIEFFIIHKYECILKEHDYLLECATGTTAVIDLLPSAIYTPIRTFMYVLTKVISSEHTKKDIKLLIATLKGPIALSGSGYTNKLHNILVYNTVLEALLDIWCVKEIDIVGLTKEDLAKHLVRWIVAFQDFCVDHNPEIASVLHKVALVTKDDAMADVGAYNTQQTANVLYDNKVTRKTKDSRLRVTEDYHGLTGVGSDITVPPPYRKNDICYWAVDPCAIGSDDYEYPVFEYLIVYSRIYAYVKKNKI